MALGTRRYTQYDVLEAKGAFTSNPANHDSVSPDGNRLYAGPVKYPRMLYHPQGEERIVVPAEAVATPFGPKWVGEQKALVYRIVRDEQEETQAIDEGWHRTPGEAMAAAGKTPPPSSPAARVRNLEAELAAALAAKAAAEAEAATLREKLDE